MVILLAAPHHNFNNIPFIQWRFAARYFSHSPPVFQRLFFTTEESSAVQYGPRRMKLRDLMAATLRFLQNDCAAYRVLWDWSPCVSQLLTSDIMVRGYVPAFHVCFFLFFFGLNLVFEYLQYYKMSKRLKVTDDTFLLWIKQNHFYFCLCLQMLVVFSQEWFRNFVPILPSVRVTSKVHVVHLRSINRSTPTDVSILSFHCLHVTLTIFFFCQAGFGCLKDKEKSTRINFWSFHLAGCYRQTKDTIKKWKDIEYSQAIFFNYYLTASYFSIFTVVTAGTRPIV